MTAGEQIAAAARMMSRSLVAIPELAEATCVVHGTTVFPADATAAIERWAREHAGCGGARGRVRPKSRREALR